MFDRSAYYLTGLSLPWKIAAVLLGTAVLTLSSYIQVPMFPVPMTMQTLAVTLAGAFLGARWGTLTVLAWLSAALIGLPVLAGHGAGVAQFLGPTGGYLFAFPFAALLVGILVKRGWNGDHILLAFAAMLAGNVVCLTFGAARLALLIGPGKAIALGVTPFLAGMLVKSALGAALLKARIPEG